MVSRDFQTLSARRIDRARTLATRLRAAQEVLFFATAVFAFQRDIFPRIADRESLLLFRQDLVDLVVKKGPEPLRESAERLDVTRCRQALQSYWKGVEASSLDSFFAHVLLQPYAYRWKESPSGVAGNHCPHCGHGPQVGVLRPRDAGQSLTLLCSLCLGEWPFERGCCIGCGERAEGTLVYYTAEKFGHLSVQACEECRIYCHLVDLQKDPRAVPDVDELAALPMDVWAQEHGYRKITLNLAGI